MTPSRSNDSPPLRRHGAHAIYLRPVEAQKLWELVDACRGTDAAWGADEDLLRVRDKLYAIEWASDAGPHEGVDG